MDLARLTCGLPLALALTTLTGNAEAKEVVVSYVWTLPADPESILDSVLAVETTCRHGCAHYVPHLVKTIVLPYRRTSDDFYVWMFVEDIQNAEWFSHVTVQRSHDHVQVAIRMVDPPLSASLEKATGKADDPAFDECVTIYDIAAVRASSGTPRTRLTFTSLISLSGLAAFFGSGIARGRLQEAADAIRRDLAAIHPKSR